MISLDCCLRRRSFIGLFSMNFEEIYLHFVLQSIEARGRGLVGGKIDFREWISPIGHC